MGGKLHAHLSLQDTASGQTAWSKEFSALPEDVFAMEDEIYDQLLAALDVKPTTEELALGAARPTESVDAYDLYLFAGHPPGIGVGEHPGRMISST